MFVHSSRFQKQLGYLDTLGIKTDNILHALRIERKEVLDPEKTFSLDQFIALLEFALKETGDDLYGLKLGREPHIGGTVGMMCASCENLKEAYVQGCKYFNVQGDFAEIVFVDEPQYPRIKYTITQGWLLKSPETARHEVEAMFSFLVTIMQVNSNQALHPQRIKFASIQTADENEYRNILGVVPEFGQAENEIQFRNKDLLIPMKAFNPETFDLLRSHIEAQVKRFSSGSRISEKVRTILLSSLRYRFPDIETVASRLNMSPRTLQRQLSNEQTNFKSLLQDTVFDLAKQMLRREELTVSEISYMLGYSDLGNFSRSFKKKIGCSPLEYRQNRLTHH